MTQVVVGPTKQLKQFFQIERDIVKNPNWPEANQLVIYKRGREVQLGSVYRDTNPGSRQSGTRTRDCWNESPRSSLLGHSAT